MPSRLSCIDCHARLEPETSYVRPLDREWHYLCAACYALTAHGRVTPPPGFQLYALKWTEPDGMTSLGGERSSLEYVKADLDRHRANGWLRLDCKYEIIEVPGNVEVVWPR